MNSYILAGISFVAGAAISGVTSWFIAKKRYERIHQEEMNVVWQDLQKNNPPLKIEKKSPEDILNEAKLDAVSPVQIDPFHKPDIMTYANKIKDAGYETPELENTDDYIYEIEYNDLDEDNYTVINAILYADGILADDADIPIRDVDFAVGTHYLEWMAGKDEIIVRNEKRHIDYDICRSQLTYGEMLDRHPETEQRLDYNNAVDEYYANLDDEESDEDDDSEAYDEEDDE